jgi:A/G-specific adenine glycosylase
MNSSTRTRSKKLFSKKSTGRLLNTRLNQTVFSKTFSHAQLHKPISNFVNTVIQYYKKHGRHDLPWRKTTDPYKILVSEMMLQQTQVTRVVPKYEVFLDRFPNVEVLARAELGEVYELWHGLGYNRRAKFLRDAARHIYLYISRTGNQLVYTALPSVHRSDLGIFPQTIETLEELPGVGPYTARAVYTFAYNKPTVLVETNVRACVLHHFFPHAKKGSVSERRIEKIMEECMREVDKKKIQPKAWYSALMDYGTHLKATQINPTRKSRTHVVQKKFKGSVREMRGEILRQLMRLRTQDKKIRRITLEKCLPFKKERVVAALEGLIHDGMVVLVKKNEEDFLMLAK